MNDRAEVNGDIASNDKRWTYEDKREMHNHLWPRRPRPPKGPTFAEWLKRLSGNRERND